VLRGHTISINSSVSCRTGSYTAACYTSAADAALPEPASSSSFLHAEVLPAQHACCC
jgi:hypothetical protein